MHVNGRGNFGRPGRGALIRRGDVPQVAPQRRLLRHDLPQQHAVAVAVHLRVHSTVSYGLSHALLDMMQKTANFYNLLQRMSTCIRQNSDLAGAATAHQQFRRSVGEGAAGGISR